MNIPWSSRHKRDFKGKNRYNLSNSFADPLSLAELLELTRQRGDKELLDAYLKDHSLQYTPNGGSLDLRTEIANLYSDDAIGPDNVLVFAGGQVALQTAAFAFASNGRHSIVFSPGYQSTIESPLQASGNAGITKIPLSPLNGWLPNMDDVRNAILPDKTKYMVINQPSNPAGALLSKEQQLELVDIARQQDMVVLCDEVYRLLEHDPKSSRLPAMCEAYEKGISCVTISKPWGGCGITIGWLAFADVSMRQTLLDIQYYGTACPSRASELQALMCLRASDTILAKRHAIILHNKDLLIQFVEQDYPDLFEWVRPTAGAIAALRFKGPLTTEELGNLFAAHGISIKPAYCFTDQVTPDIDYFRVGFGEAIMPTALEAFKSLVEKYKEEWRAAIAVTTASAGEATTTATNDT